MADPITAQQVEADPRLWRASWDGQLLEDLSGGVLGGSVSHDLSRAQHWSLDCTLHYDAWEYLRPFVDWVAPVMNLRYPDGSVISQQLGLYCVLDSPEQREELSGTVRLDARDVLWAVNAQGTKAPIQVTGGNFGAQAKAVLNSASVPGGLPTSRFRQTIPDFTVPIRADTYRGFPVNSRMVAVINEFLATGKHYPMYSNQLGIIGSHPITPLIDKAPLRSWYANPPNAQIYIGEDLINLAPFVGQQSPIIGAVDTSPGSADLYDQIIVVGGVGGATPIRGTASLADFFGGGGAAGSVVSGTSQTISLPMVASNSDAEAIAMAILEEMLTKNTTISLTVKPDPRFVAIHDVVRLGIWDLRGREVALGKFLVKRVQYGMTVDNPLMKVDLGALSDAVPI